MTYPADTIRRRIEECRNSLYGATISVEDAHRINGEALALIDECYMRAVGPDNSDGPRIPQSNILVGNADVYIAPPVGVDGASDHLGWTHIGYSSQPPVVAPEGSTRITRSTLADKLAEPEDDVPRTVGSQLETLLPHYDDALRTIHVDPASEHGRRLRGLAILRLVDGYLEYGHALFLQDETELVREEDEELADYLNRRARRIGLEEVPF